MEFLAELKKAGFVDVERVSETGFNSSPKTKDMFIRTHKPENGQLLTEIACRLEGEAYQTGFIGFSH